MNTRKENKLKILVGYDGSRVSEDALKLAQEHALAFEAYMHIVTSLQQSHELEKEAIEEAEGKLDHLKLNFDFDKIPSETHASVTYLTPGDRSGSICQRKRY